MKETLRIEGYRDDGVFLLDLGDKSMVMANVVDHRKTRPIDVLSVTKYGPWRHFSDTQPTETVRELLTAIVETPGNIVSPELVGVEDFAAEIPPGQPSRQELSDMLSTANLDVAQELPQEQNFQEDPDFLSHCLQDIVPQLQSSGVAVGDPSSFCALMHLERTGLMPHSEMDMAPAPVAEPAPEAVAETPEFQSQDPFPPPDAVEEMQADAPAPPAELAMPVNDPNPPMTTDEPVPTPTPDAGGTPIGKLHKHKKRVEATAGKS